MKKLFAFVFFAFLLGTIPSLEAQSNQEGSVEIAGAIEPTVNTTLEGHVNCVAGLVKSGVSAEAAVKSCEKITNRTTRAAEGMANSAQKAAQASRIPADNCCGYGYRRSRRIGVGVGLSWGQTRAPRYNRPPVRRAPPPRRQR